VSPHRTQSSTREYKNLPCSSLVFPQNLQRRVLQFFTGTTSTSMGCHANYCVKSPRVFPADTTPSAREFSAPSAISRSVAVSISAASRRMKRVLLQAGGMAGRNSTTIVPGNRCKARRGQNNPEFNADRNAWHANLGVKMGERRTCSVELRRPGARVPSGKIMSWRPLWISIWARAVHVGQRLGTGAAIDRNHAALPHAPAEDRYPHQLALDDEGKVVEQPKQRKRLPGRLMLGRDDQRPSGRFSSPRNSTLVPQTTRNSHTLTRPQSSAILRTARRGSASVMSATTSSTTRFQVKQDVEKDGPDDDHVLNH
jgi:hypothetical protein